MLLFAIALMLAGVQETPVRDTGGWTDLPINERTRAQVAADDLFDCYVAEMIDRNVDLNSKAAKIRRLDIDAARFCAKELHAYRRLRGAKATKSVFRRMFDDYWARL